MDEKSSRFLRPMRRISQKLALNSSLGYGIICKGKNSFDYPHREDISTQAAGGLNVAGAQRCWKTDFSDMSRFSILIIGHHVSVAAAITQVVSQYLDDYRLSIIKEVVEAINTPEAADLILLNASQLSDNAANILTSLKRVYPDVTILLLREASAKDEQLEEEVLLTALSAGADDYVSLSKAGRLILRRRLTQLHNDWQTRQSKKDESPPALTSNASLDIALVSDTSQLAVQIIGPDNRVRTWNQTAEVLLGLNREDAIGKLIEDLPLSAQNLNRLKDILDQARVTGESFSIPDYPLEDPHRETRWLRVNVYPLRENPLAAVADMCIISTDMTDLKQSEAENWQYNQELQILLETSRESSKHLELQRTLEQFIDQTKTLLNADNCCVYFLEKDNQTLRPALAVGPLSGHIKATSLTVGQGIIGVGATRGKAALVNFANQQGEKTLYGHEISALPSKEEHLLYAPLTARNGMIGMMIATRSDKSPFAEDDLRFFENLVQQGSSAINNARSRSRVTT